MVPRAGGTYVLWVLPPPGADSNGALLDSLLGDPSMLLRKIVLLHKQGMDREAGDGRDGNYSANFPGK